jgi:hypothetical protein
MHNAMTWEQICDDPHLRHLPYKIEQNRHGRIVMSPAKADHGRLQGSDSAVSGQDLGQPFRKRGNPVGAVSIPLVHEPERFFV